MKLPRNVSGVQLIKVLNRLGYEISRQTGIHFDWSANCRSSII
ncbi:MULTISPECIES: type II toxin-antitoxin system HicA family toxin [Nitrosomonas]|nr:MULTISPECIES: type II toxin-antitoxin system HicA family toxin [Nitrosomonas]UVS61015.1 hypothetical protein NX761_16240 [Nitrosomonas sp. PLL12]